MRVGQSRSVLDLGTGTGVIALMMAQRSLQARVWALEIQADAVAEARENAAASPWQDRIEIVAGDLRHPKEDWKGKFDLLVSNPPFFFGHLPSQNPARDLWRTGSDQKQADWVAAMDYFAAPGGLIGLVLPCDQLEKWEKLFRARGWYPGRICRVRGRAENATLRVLVEFLREVEAVGESELVIQVGGPNEYTPEYIRLTRDFYPWME